MHFAPLSLSLAKQHHGNGANSERETLRAGWRVAACAVVRFKGETTVVLLCHCTLSLPHLAAAGKVLHFPLRGGCKLTGRRESSWVDGGVAVVLPSM